MDTDSEDRQSPKDTLLVVDGHSLAFRAFFALPVENFTTQSGQATNAVWGFATMLAQVIETERPNHLAVAFDMSGGTFRNNMLKQYKATRDAAPEELLSQLPLIQQLLASLGITYVERRGFEGDDIIATLATMGSQARYKTLVLSGDRDAFQLIDDYVTVLYPGHHFKELKHMTADAVQEKYHVSPSQYPDLAAMRGETADNIPGVPGVGDGYAAKWINQYGGLQGIYEHAEEIGGKKGIALRENIEQVKLNRKVNALVRDMDLGVDISDLEYGDIKSDDLSKLFDSLQFGERTRKRVITAFGADAANKLKQAEASNDADIAGEQPKAEIATVLDSVGDSHAFQAWLTEHAHTVEDSAAPSNDEHGNPALKASTTAAAALPNAITVFAAGKDLPGREAFRSLAIVAADEHVLVLDDATENAELLHSLQQFLDDYQSQILLHGYKEQRHILSACGLELHEPLFDTKLAGYIVEPDFHADSLSASVAHFLDIHDDNNDVTIEQGSFAFDDTDSEESKDKSSSDEHALPKSVKQAILVSRLARYLMPIVDERRQYRLLRSIEIPVSSTLYAMESSGASVSTQRMKELHDRFIADASQAQDIAWENAGSKINLQSPKQLQKVLFEDLGLKPSRKTKGGSYTTNAAALQSMYLKSTDNAKANDFLGALLRYRETNKLKQIMQTLIDAVNVRDGRIHTTFEQTVAATGRLSSVDPNLQNIPNRNAQGREIRSAFVPASGYDYLLSSDYSQVELRIMADLSGDEALIEAFKSGRDFHKYVASLVYQKSVDDITGDERSHVKAMSYGLAYGLSTYGLAQRLSVSPAEADVLRQKYFATFGKVHEYLESLVSTARDKGYTETMFGRRRYFPGLKSARRQIRDAAERGALNAPIQGSAADIMKIAMIRADVALRSAGMKSRIVLQIHDELVLEVVESEVKKVTALVIEAMEHAVHIAVPLDVSTGLGADWQQAAH
ncbi:DNA polymerase I [Bifidobacterium aquikefiri]|uniref:DNA polymerase I n=1 Tax=Bifidobacterium aquikefiri TaxID=1653207 RepID=UPI0023F3DCB9|nr:DNA polymerase I [Bifidobacterium aquikefiri]